MADTGKIRDVGGGTRELGDKAGFQTSGYIVKKAGIPEGEGGKFNVMPPGMEIGAQPNADIRDLPLKEVTKGSYPGDGWD